MPPIFPARPSPRRPADARFLRGFTIAELLVSMAVLALMLLLVVQVVGHVANILSLSDKSVESGAAVRFAFDRLEADLLAAVNREDTPFHIRKQTGNDELAFYSEVDGYYPSGDPAYAGSGNPSGAGNPLAFRNPVSLVGWRIGQPQGGLAGGLERLSRGLHWSGAGDDAVGLLPCSLITATGSSTLVSGSARTSPIPDLFGDVLAASAPNTSRNLAGQWDVAGELVFRFEISFLLRGKGGTVSQAPSADGSPTWNRADVAAIIVTVAALDNTSRAPLSNPADALQIIAGLLTDDPAGGTRAPGSTEPDTAERWNNALLSALQAPPAGVPKRVLSAVRVYQRTFYLNGTTPP